MFVITLTIGGVANDPFILEPTQHISSSFSQPYQIPFNPPWKITINITKKVTIKVQPSGVTQWNFLHCYEYSWWTSGHGSFGFDSPAFKNAAIFPGVPLRLPVPPWPWPQTTCWGRQVHCPAAFLCPRCLGGPSVGRTKKAIWTRGEWVQWGL